MCVFRAVLPTYSRYSLRFCLLIIVVLQCSHPAMLTSQRPSSSSILSHPTFIFGTGTRQMLASVLLIRDTILRPLHDVLFTRSSSLSSSLSFSFLSRGSLDCERRSFYYNIFGRIFYEDALKAINSDLTNIGQT